MTELATIFAVLAPTVFTFMVAAHTPHTADGRTVNRSRRSFVRDVRSFLGASAY